MRLFVNFLDPDGIQSIGASVVILKSRHENSMAPTVFEVTVFSFYL